MSSEHPAADRPRAARIYRRRLDRLNADLDRLRDERDEVIRRAYRDGLPLSDMAEAFGLSRQRVARMCGEAHKRA